MSVGNYDINTWREADVALQSILDNEPGNVTTYVDSMNLDPAVRECLDRLLQESERSGVLDGDALVSARASESTLSGRTFGNWTLGEQIGRGGMALVYRASRPIRDFEQLAAIKLLPRGMAGTDHFRREQEVLSKLDHPNIARFLDAGVDDDGTPWIAMELVDGLPVDRFSHTLTTREKVRLFVHVIEAVSYAHQHLIVHRDIKPSNILVDAEGRPRLLDFGIAKLVSEGSDSASTRILTPEYAAPEQFTGGSVSTATDVHGLGATLYALLGNRPPQGRDGKQVRHDFFQSIDPDLRNIVDKCLRENPRDRYSGASELADDIRAWLADLPVRATPDSRRYRLKKWYARHRAAAIGAVLVVLAMAGGAGGIAWQAQKTQRQAETVEAQLEVLKELLASPQTVARGKQVRMVDVLSDAGTTIRKYLPNPTRERAELFSSLARTLTQTGSGNDAIPLWEQAISDLHDAGGTNAQSLSYQLGLARAHIDSDQREEASRIAERLRPQTDPVSEMRAIVELIDYQTRRTNDAAAAMAILEELLNLESRVTWSNTANEGEFRCGMLQALVDAGRYAQAAEKGENLLTWGTQTFGEEHSHTLCAYQALPVIYSGSGNLERAVELARRGADIATNWLGEDSMMSFSLRHGLANILEEQGEFEAAIALHSELLAIAPSIPGMSAEDRIMPAMGLAVAYQESGRYEEAEPMQAQVIEHLRQHVGEAAPTTLIAITNLAELRIFSGQVDAAIDDASRAHRALESSLGARHPVTLFARSVLGGAYAHSNNHEVALQLLDALPEEMAAAFGPDDINVVNARIWRAMALQQDGRPAEAKPLAEAGLVWRVNHLGADHPRSLAAERLVYSLRETVAQESGGD